MVAFNQTRANIIANGVMTRIRKVYLVSDDGKREDVTDDFLNADIYLFTGDTSVFKTYLWGAKHSNENIVAICVEEEVIRDNKVTQDVVFYKTITKGVKNS